MRACVCARACVRALGLFIYLPAADDHFRTHAELSILRRFVAAERLFSCFRATFCFPLAAILVFCRSVSRSQGQDLLHLLRTCPSLMHMLPLQRQHKPRYFRVTFTHLRLHNLTHTVNISHPQSVKTFHRLLKNKSAVFLVCSSNFFRWCNVVK